MGAVPFSSRGAFNTNTFVVEPCDVALRIVASDHSSGLWFLTHTENFIFVVGVMVFRFKVTCQKLW